MDLYRLKQTNKKEGNYSGFWLFAVNVTYKMVLNTELTNTEPLLLGNYRARFLWVSGHNTVTNRPIRNLVLCVFLIRGTLFDMYWWSVTIKLTANSTVSQALTRLIKYTYFLRKAQHISTMPRSRFKQQNHRQKAWHDTAPTGHLYVVWELEQGGSRSPCLTSAGNVNFVHSNFSLLYTNQGVTEKVPSMLLVGLHITFSE